MFQKAWALVQAGAVISCSEPAPRKDPDFVTCAKALAHAPIARIEGLDHRIASLPKGDSIPISQVLRQFDLWSYRQAVRSERHSNVVGLDFSDGETICFIAEEEPRAYTIEELSEPGSEWDRDIKKLHIWRIFYRGVRTDLK
ncbi:hypothetical protein JIN85_18345 [Luteolibacter pohnpeiensis]|uniref:Uncharacterized protein n=1 Tax=Luteolibacter pohnpeiensis TaxID=454153 RepID=A0A934SAP1_9BACT|nr:hypothetical protein [Luteolibacter pohnpeiensis]MBK1884384.1 hypothetical protein [Luteolibacter pohnpeiensis]